jgi:enamine deaminase RidA (YjgF/YER057c/UK114 family)
MQPTNPRGAAPAGEGRQPRHTVLHPAGWPRPKGYAYGVVAEGRVVCLSGIIGWDADGRLVGDDLVSQARQALTTIALLVREAGGTPGDIVRMTWYIVDKREYLAAQEALGAAYRAVMGRHFSAMTVVEVAGLLEDRARVEIEVTAVLEEPR